MTLLLGRRRRSNDGAGWLLPTKHLQNLLRGLRPCVGLVWVGLSLLVLGIYAIHVGLARLSGLSLIVGAVFGVILFLIFAVIAFGRRLSNPRLSVPRLRDDKLLVERLRLRKAVRRHRPRIVLIDVRGGLGLSRRRCLERKHHARNSCGI